MARRYYSSTAARTTLASGVDDTTTTFNVVAVSGWPATYPYTLVIDQDTVNEELVEVSARSGTTLTVTRGVDGTSAVAHDSGAAVNHGVSARDFDEPNAFINGTGVVTSTMILDGTIVNADINASAAIAQSKIADLTSDLASKADLASIPYPNLLYNGAMRVAQRGTSATGITTGGYYTADRWKVARSATNSSVFTQSVENDGPTASGLTKSLKYLFTTADASPATDAVAYHYQILEGHDVQRLAKGTASAKELTASFWVKSNATGTYVVSLLDADNNRIVSATYLVSASATWEKKTVTFPADTSGILDNDNAGSLWLAFALYGGSDYTSGTLASSWQALNLNDWFVGQTNLAAATNNYWQITGVQLEVGDTATEFEHLPFGVELARCQRYYFRSFSTSGTYARHGWVMATSTTNAYCHVNMPVTMRSSPNMVEMSNISAAAAAASFPLSSPTISESSVNMAMFLGTAASGLSANTFYELVSQNSAAGYIGIGAEL